MDIPTLKKVTDSIWPHYGKVYHPVPLKYTKYHKLLLIRGLDNKDLINVNYLFFWLCRGIFSMGTRSF